MKLWKEDRCEHHEQEHNFYENERFRSHRIYPILLLQSWTRIIGMWARLGLKAQISTVSFPLTAPKDSRSLASTKNNNNMPFPRGRIIPFGPFLISNIRDARSRFRLINVNALSECGPKAALSYIRNSQREPREPMERAEHFPDATYVRNEPAPVVGKFSYPARQNDRTEGRLRDQYHRYGSDLGGEL